MKTMGKQAYIGFNRRQRRLFSAVLLTVLALLCLWLPARAQTPEPPIELNPQTPALRFTSIDTRDFPTLRAQVQYLQGMGAPLTLRAEMLTLLEDGVTILPDQLQARYEGIHFALAIDPNFKFDLRDANGLSPFAKIKTALQVLDPVFAPGAGDRFSLVIPPDTKLDGIDTFREFNEALLGYDQSTRQMNASLNSLADALSILNGDQSGKDKVLLWVSPSPNMRYMDLFQELMQQALARHIRVYVILVATPSELQTGAGKTVAELSALTGGGTYSFDGHNELPDPSAWFEGLGQSYQLSYASGVRQGGEHELIAECNGCAEALLRSEPFSFDLDVQPPSVDFIAPPTQLELLVDAEGLTDPVELPIELSIDFPDGHPRPLTKVEILANGALAISRDDAPFNSLVLPLIDYAQAERLSLEALLYDDIGLVGSSPTITVDLEAILVDAPAPKPWYQSPWFGALAGLLLLGSLAAVFVLGRRRPKKPQKVKASPLAVPVDIAPVKSLATLVRLDADARPLAEKPVYITEEITLIGQDAQMAQLVLDDPALEGLHAQLHIYADGSARITDFNSTAGTFVNYETVGAKGHALQHGDLVLIGSQLYRFNHGLGLSGKQTGTEEATP